MKLVVLERFAMNEGDLNWAQLQTLATSVTLWPRTEPNEIIARIGDAEGIVLNKCRIEETVLAACTHLKWIGITATGTDAVDLAACRKRGIAVANVPGYSTQSVAQHTFALLLELTNAVAKRSQTVADGFWQVGVPESYGIGQHTELWGKTFGIVGYGAIGQAVGRIAQGFGMNVVAFARTQRPEHQASGVTFLPLDEVLRQSDVISLHCPATAETTGMIGAPQLAMMKPGAMLLNTARGALIDEAAVAQSAAAGHVFYAADAVIGEPIQPENPLFGAKNVLITPHMAWVTQAALERLANEVCQNLAAFLRGEARNLVT